MHYPFKILKCQFIILKCEKKKYEKNKTHMAKTADDIQQYIEFYKSNPEYIQAIMAIRKEEEELAFRRGIEQKVNEELSKKKQKQNDSSSNKEGGETGVKEMKPERKVVKVCEEKKGVSATKRTKQFQRQRKIFVEEDEQYYYFYTYKRLK